MKLFDSKDIRNVALIGHKASGKTTLAEAGLWSAKATNRLGSTAQGNSVLDFEDEEQKRGMSTSTGIAQFAWKKHKFNLLDTPGDVNFLNDTRIALNAVEAAVCTVSAKDGAEPMTERVYGWAKQAGLPRAIMITKMDAEHADFDRSLKDIKTNLESDAAAVQLPIGQESGFKGVIDLLSQRAYFFKDGDEGLIEEGAIPSDLEELAEDARNTLIEDIATHDEDLMEKYFEGILSSEEILEGLKSAMKEGLIVPVFCSAASLNQGVGLLLDFAAQAFPSPLEHAPFKGSLDGASSARNASPDAPLSCYCFKTIVDQHAGKISVMRVISGEATGDTTLKNPNSEEAPSERLGTLNTVVGKKLSAIESAPTGDMFAVAKLKDTHTQDTLSSDGWVADGPKLAQPLISRAVHAKDKSAEDKILSALQRILEEDPGLSLSRDESTGEMLLSGTGQQHIEVAVEKMQRKFGVSCELSLPRIPYQETFTAPVKGVEGKHKKQTGGHGQFAVAFMDFEPGPRGSGLVFEDAIVGGAVPRQFIPSVEKGCLRAMSQGLIAGYPLVDIKVRLYDGKYHAVDSSDMAFQVAAGKGFRAAAEKARPVLLEPIMNVEITVPEANMGDVMGDVSTRRGRVNGSEPAGKYMVIKAQIPLAEVQQYEATLRSMTQGRGSFTMEASHMEQVPAHVQEKIVKESGFVASDADE